MRKMKVGIWLFAKYVPTKGGGFGYYSELIECISRTQFSNADICFFGEHSSSSDKIGYYQYHKISKQDQLTRKILRFIKLICPKALYIKAIRNLYYTLERKLNNSLHKLCDIIYYPTQLCKYDNFPFIYTLMDLGHLNTYAFPELSHQGNFEERSEHFNNIPFKALMVFCESEAGKKEAIHYLRLHAERIRVLPLFPSGVVTDRITPKKPQEIDPCWTFIHYPAQFWAHKNHYNLLCAFSLIASKYPSIRLIFTGSDHGNKTYIKNSITKLHLEDRVVDLGFVSLEELKWIYINSKGLIMPTLLGPTNMPPLEALSLSCPVAVSDLPGHREQLGDNAIYFNPLNIEEIKNAIEKILNCDNKRTISEFPSLQKSMLLLDKYFAELSIIRHTWD